MWMTLSTVKGLFMHIKYFCVCVYVSNKCHTERKFILELCTRKKKMCTQYGVVLITRQVEMPHACCSHCFYSFLLLLFHLYRPFQMNYIEKFFPFFSASSFDTTNGTEQLKCVQGYAYMPQALSDVLRAVFFFCCAWLKI